MLKVNMQIQYRWVCIHLRECSSLRMLVISHPLKYWLILHVYEELTPQPLLKHDSNDYIYLTTTIMTVGHEASFWLHCYLCQSSFLFFVYQFVLFISLRCIKHPVFIREAVSRQFRLFLLSPHQGFLFHILVILHVYINLHFKQ